MPHVYQLLVSPLADEHQDFTIGYSHSLSCESLPQIKALPIPEITRLANSVTIVDGGQCAIEHATTHVVVPL